ncbi:Vegetative incompatibility protein HET-E-1 [Ceratocystis lukuohia]|uniref:Vegetative incompatibility protein HET-E-1 n=1 Tax=Ceratocystis lukuohia TaxID=2019550 RepID=A0ABR4M8P7_9PEZI
MDSSMPQTTGPPVWLLSLDGGGVYGLSSLLILENIMECIQKSEGLSEVPRPCDRFDLIGGTGTGGIIAIMLGRLKMSIDQSIKEYKCLASEIFAPERTRAFKIPASAFSAAKLKAAIERMIRNNCTDSKCRRRKRDRNNTGTDRCPHGDMLLADENCTKTAVLAMTKANIETRPTFLTTYDTPGHLTDCKVWQAARATSAAITLFDPIKLGRDGIEFIDASYGYNNPCEALISEAERQFSGRHIMILSIGTGLGDVVEISDSRSSVLKALRKMATSSKQTDLRLKKKYKSPGVYHRFNVDIGLRDKKVLDRRTFGNIAAHTVNYLEENNQSVEQFVATFTRSDVPQLKAQHDENDKKCLSALCNTDPSTDKKEIESRKGGLLEESYRWILSHKNFLQFLDESESPILWIKGDPGKGKTMLLCGIIDELERTNPTSLSYFFCQATNHRVNTATSVLRGLIYRLARQNPHLTTHVRDKYDYNQNLFQSTGAWQELCEILTSMLNDPSLKNAILVVDALDECSTRQKDLLEFIAKPSRAKWIVSSRNSPDIEEVLNDAEQNVKIHLEINEESVSAAVNSFIDFKVDQLAHKKKYNREMKHAVSEHLRLNADGTFLWVSLVCQELSNSQKWHTAKKLRSFPPGLYPLYGRMLEQIRNSEDAQLCKDIIANVLVTYRPVTWDELYVLVEALDDLEEDDVKRVVSLCGSFLTVHKNVVSFVHQSAKDYFQEKALGEILPFGIQHQHQTIFSRSLDVLHKELRRDMYNLTAPGCLIEEVSVPQPDPLAAIGYFCLFWVDHLNDSSTNGMVSKNDEILAFLREKYLQWLEALSLLKVIPGGIRGMEKLKLCSEKASRHLRDLVNDAHRFFLFHAGVIEIAPLQVYVSALIFSPTKSLIRQIYSNEEPRWIDQKPWVEEKWDFCLRTLEGHYDSETSVVFSNDGQRLASGSDDNTVKIWDATSGVCLRTLYGHRNSVMSVVFSNDGQLLASGSWDHTVKIWDATSGVCLRTLHGHRNSVMSVVFSNDGQRLASGSDDNTVKIWDATSGVCLQTLEGHYDSETSVVFSNDGQRLASGSDDNTVKIWDATSGVCLQTLEGHYDSETSVVFSNDGQRLASGSDDNTVKIWDATSGTCLLTLGDHDSYVTSVVFSSDGQRLASGSDDNTVKIWDATSGVCLQTLEGHYDSETSVVFSNDGQQLASGSDDNTVKIWDATSGVCLRTLYGHRNSVMSVVFSNDGQLLASGSWDNTVKIWDATSGVCLRTLHGHRNSVMSVVFSNDGQRLASGSYDNTVKIWDATCGVCLKTLEGHYDSETSVAFSNDGRRLASESDDFTVKIWDRTSPACPQTLEGHHRGATSVAFSNDGRRLASGSWGNTVKIWDATSGVCLRTLHGHRNSVMSVVFSNDGQRLASGSDDNTVKIWDATSGVCLQTLEGHYDSETSVVFSNDGQRLASGSYDNTVKLWDATCGVCLKTLAGHNEEVTAVTFSNCDQKLASGSGDKTVKVWDANSGMCMHTLEGHGQRVTSVVFSNSGQRLASGSRDKTVKIWDATSGTWLYTLKDHDYQKTSVVFSNDERQLASGSMDMTVKIWGATSFLRTPEHKKVPMPSLDDGKSPATDSTTEKNPDEFSSTSLDTPESPDVEVTPLESDSQDKTTKDATLRVQRQSPRQKKTSSSLPLFDLSSLPSGLKPSDLDIFKSPAIQPSNQASSFTFELDGAWIMENKQRVLWLPPGYRTSESDVAISANRLAMRFASGRVLIIGFKSAGWRGGVNSQ